MMRFAVIFVALAVASVDAEEVATGRRGPYSGIYPHLASFNDENECGTGAVVPWAERLWVITYAPHKAHGSSDKLYEIDADLNMTVRPESVGGTPANRMIHRESNQLFIGPYAIDDERRVRVISPETMPGRLTANARHLTASADKIYFATMEEGFYEVDVHTLAVVELFRDANLETASNRDGLLLPGYHGKGAYSGHGRLVYANNGERSEEALRQPNIASGCLAEWDGSDWRVIRRNQFTEVTGPGGIYGNEHPHRDPIWSIGWDHRSLILMVLDAGRWHAFRLPKASHCYDGAHGWNTEWPRIRDIGQHDLLMTMHGTFWRFPRTFSASNTAGLRPRSTYLKVIGDFCRWNDRLVFGCDDAARSEFLNRRKAKGSLASPGQSQSNLWFVEPDALGQFGAPLGRGAVWINDEVRAGQCSDPYLLAGYERRSVHIAHETDESVTFDFEIDPDGDGRWCILRSVTLPARGSDWVEFAESEQAQWIRVRTNRDGRRVTVFFNYANADTRPARADARFAGLAPISSPECTAARLLCRGDNRRTLLVGSLIARGDSLEEVGCYELADQMRLRPVDEPGTAAWLAKQAPFVRGALTVDAASVVYVDDAGHRWRLPKGDAAFDTLVDAGVMRISREVVTERDLFHSHGTFYELPAENAGGMAKIRPISSHNRRIVDYSSYRGLLVLSGIDPNVDCPQVIRSDDGRAAVWVGTVDDLWTLGKAVGHGGPWRDTTTTAHQPSDPYLMTGYDVKKLWLAHQSPQTVAMRVEVDITGEGDWVLYHEFPVPPGQRVEHTFPNAYQAYWLRVVADRDCVATAQLAYE